VGLTLAGMAGPSLVPQTMPDPRESMAILIGTAAYEHLTALPAVERNLVDLHELLTDEFYWGLPGERCRVLANPLQPSDVETALRDAATAVGRNGQLLVYYAGHGIIADNGSLHLGVRATEGSLIGTTSFPYALLRERVVASAAMHRVVILDCCYAGRALDTMAAGDAELRIDRAAVLAATSRTATAYAPADEEYTAFSGELIRTLRVGLPSGPDPLDMRTLWHAVRGELESRGRPLPELRDHNAGVVLVRNAALRTGPGLTGHVLVSSDGSLGASGSARLLVLDHRPEVGAVAVRLDARTDRPVHQFLAEWAGITGEPKVLFDGGPLAPLDAIGVAVVRDHSSAPSSFRPLAGRVGVLDLGADPRYARDSRLSLRVFVGYFGWGPGQLENELSDGRLTSAGPITPEALGYQ
jgi:hypothetical protein